MGRTIRAVAGCFVLGFLPGAAGAQFSVLETDEVRLLYLDPFQTYLVPHVARCYINALGFERELFGYTPDGKPTVLLKDFSDQGNASATAVPRDFLAFETSPMSTAYEAVSPNERFNWLMNHELFHVVSTDGATKADRRARAFFGGKVLPNNDDPESILYFYLTAPRVSSPGWYLEGSATFFETWMAGGQGRAQGPYDEMVFRAMVRDGATIYDPLGLVSQGIKIDFQIEVNSYLYGTRFMTYLGYRYSPEHVVRWVSRTEGSKAYYAKSFEATFGLPLARAWDDWIAFEKEFQGKNLEEIRKYPTTAHRDVSARALGSVSRAYVDEASRRIYVAFNYPGLVAHVGSISMDDGTIDPIVEVKGPVLFTVTSLAWDPERRLLFYTADNGEFRDVHALDLATGKSRRLLKDARVGDLVFDRTDRSLWGVRHFNGIATIVKIPYPYEQWSQVHSFPYGEVPYDIDVSPDGTLLSASIGQIDGSHAVHVLRTADLLAGKVEDVAKFDFATFIPSGFVFSADGRYLQGSSYYTGVSNVFRYEIETGKLDALSNAETGFFRPVPLSDGSMVVFRYSGQGFVPATIDPVPLEDVSAITFLGAQLVDKHPVVKDWKLGSPAKVPLDQLVTKRGPYRSFASIRPESFYPILEGYKDSPAAGMRFNFSDPLQMNRFQLNASYSPDSELPSEERLHLRLQYKRYDWTVDAKWNAADFYDLFGPTKSSRKGYALRTAWERALYHDRPKQLTLTADAAYYGDLDTLPYYQNVASPSDKLATAFVKLHYQNVRSSLGRVDEEKGQRAELYLSATHTPDPTCTPVAGLGNCNPTTAPEGGFFPQVLATYDLGFQLPITHSSVWMRVAAGGGTGDPTNPFANFFFGGFGNNWVDNGEVKRYRQWYAFPGLELNEAGGRTFAKATVEWNLPPIRFKRLGTPGFYASWLRTSLFVSALSTNFDRRFGDVYEEDPGTGVWSPVSSRIAAKIADAGLQMDVRITWLSRLDMTLSLGYAAAFESGLDTRHEGMISLKVMP